MKKITIILFALIAGTTFAQNSAEATAVVNAKIVSPITLASSQALNFGSIVKTDNGGTVTLHPKTGKRTYSDSKMEVNSSSFALAMFDVSIEQDYTYSVAITNTSLKLDGADDMALKFTHSFDPTSNASSGNTKASFGVGGELTVNANQAVGKYTGTAAVTVTYE